MDSSTSSTVLLCGRRPEGHRGATSRSDRALRAVGPKGGARRIFTAGFWILTVASLAAGLAGTPTFEFVARAAQGVGAALIAPSALTLLMTLFGHDRRELARAMAFYGAAAPAGGTAGVFLGGVLTEWLDWPWVFYVNLPVGIAVLAVVTRLLPGGTRRPGMVDVFGG